MALGNKLNRQGRGTVYFAGQGSQQDWQMKREMLSPRYTMQGSDLPIVRANELNLMQHAKGIFKLKREKDRYF